MTVLTIIGILSLVAIVYMLMMLFDDYTYKNYNYEFFQWNSFIIMAGSYLSIFIGKDMYVKALANNGDILNGQLLIIFGAIALIYVFIINIKNTNLLVGTFGSIFQFTIYAVLTVISFFALLVIVLFLSQTKPVYVINK